MKRLIFRLLVYLGERLEDRVLVGDEGCLWPVEWWRVRLQELEDKRKGRVTP